MPEPPADGWTWDEFAATSKQLTDKSKGTFGTAWPAVGDEDTVWRIWPPVWQAGGDIITEDGKVGFGGQPGEQAFGVLDRLAQDGSVYVDTKPDTDQTYQLFNNGKIGMVITGPWQLPDFIDAKIDFGVAPLPTFGGEPLTISAPDTWTLFDNGDKRSKAAIEFVQWLNSPEQDAKWVTKAGSLPLRKGTAEQPVWKDVPEDRSPGCRVFLAGLDGARTKPTNPAYPQISEAMGQSLVAVLLEALVAAGRAAAGGRRRARESSPAEAERRVAVAVERAALRARSGSSARRRPPGCGSRPAVVIILGLSLAADGLVAAAVASSTTTSSRRAPGSGSTTTRRCSTTRRSAARSSTR